MENREIDSIVIHVTDSPDTMDVGFAEINMWHMERGFTPFNGWIYCGYHKVIRRSGALEIARPDSVPGIHVAGHNQKTLAVVWVGRSHIADKQYQTLIRVVADWILQYELDIQDVYGHHELFKGKSCPNLEMSQVREDILIELNERTSDGIPQ